MLVNTAVARGRNSRAAAAFASLAYTLMGDRRQADATTALVAGLPPSPAFDRLIQPLVTELLDDPDLLEYLEHPDA
jgi:hypothetical protein